MSPIDLFNGWRQAAQRLAKPDAGTGDGTGRDAVSHLAGTDHGADLQEAETAVDAANGKWIGQSGLFARRPVARLGSGRHQGKSIRQTD